MNRLMVDDRAMTSNTAGESQEGDIDWYYS